MNTTGGHILEPDASLPGQLNIAGVPTTRARLALIGFLTLLIWAAALLCWTWTGVSDAGAMAGFFAFMLAVVPILLPGNRHVYLDIPGRRIVNRYTYLHFEISKEETSLAEFAGIVVRHVCHPGGEGEDTYTGSVGLKPRQGGAIIWVKGFDATADEIPAEPDGYARQLAQATGLRYLQGRAPLD